MKIKVISFLLIITFICTACIRENINTDEPVDTNISRYSTSESKVKNDGDNVLSKLSSQELLALDFLHEDWPKERFEQLGFQKVSDDQNGITLYSNGETSYTFLDFFNAISTPSIVNVIGKTPGPRNIQVGDTLSQILEKFPAEREWKNSSSGVFYGQYDSDAETNGMSGRVDVYEFRKKELTILTEDSVPYLRVYFENDIVTNYSIYLTGD